MSTDAPRRAGRPAHPLDRRAVARVARGVFAREGFGGATLDAIAAGLGIRRASLLHHFPSKEALYAEAVDFLVEELALVLASATAEGEFPERLDRLSVALTLHLAAHPEAAALLLRELGGPRTVGAAAASQALVALQAAAAFVQHGIDLGHVPRQDAVQLVMSILGLHLVWFAVPAVSELLAGGTPFTPERAAARAEVVRRQVRRLCSLPEEG